MACIANPEIEKKCKIFIIGFNKTGTRTLDYLFKNNGYKTAHWEGGDITDEMTKNINIENILGKYKVMMFFQIQTKLGEILRY